MGDLAAILSTLKLPEFILLCLTFGFALYAAVRMLAESYAEVEKILGPLGRRWAAAKQQRTQDAITAVQLRADNQRLTEQLDEKNREVQFLRDMQANDKWNADLRRQVDALAASMTLLRDRVDITDAYLIYDEQWHRHDQLSRDDVVMEPHQSFLEFERRWKEARDD